MKTIKFLDKYLKAKEYQTDYSNNGLQVEFKGKVKKVCLAVDISLAAVEYAKSKGCNLLVVHHGLIWGKSLSYVTQRNYKIIKALMDNNIGLYASHAPIDAHPKVGNNIQLSKIIGLKKTIPFGTHNKIIWGRAGEFSKELSPEQFLKKIDLINENSSYYFVKPVKKVIVVSGGGSFVVDEAFSNGYDTVLTGETSHSNMVVAKDLGINIVFAGHYKTETYGVIALSKILEKECKVKTIFFEDDTGF